MITEELHVTNRNLLPVTTNMDPFLETREKGKERRAKGRTTFEVIHLPVISGLLAYGSAAQ